MPLALPSVLPPLDRQTEPDKVRVAAVVGGMLGAAPARGFGLTADELTVVEDLAAGDYPVATAQTRNRIVNGAMQISQELGTTGSTTTGAYVADQWTINHSGLTAFGGALNAPSAGVPNQIYIGGTKASLAAGDHCYILQPIEGVRVRDFNWGTANALPAVLRFECNSALAGTYSIAIRSGDTGRTFLAPFTTVTGLWTTFVIPVSGDTAAGTYPITTAQGISVAFTFASGTTYLGSAGWQAGNKLGVTGMSNGVATNASHYIRNVGLYLDPLATGIAPPWTMPDEAEELMVCQRYWEKIGMTVVTTSPPYANTSWYRQTKRISPSLTLAGTFNTATVNVVTYSPLDGARQIAVASAPGDAWVIASARM